MSQINFKNYLAYVYCVYHYHSTFAFVGFDISESKHCYNDDSGYCTFSY